MCSNQVVSNGECDYMYHGFTLEILSGRGYIIGIPNPIYIQYF